MMATMDSPVSPLTPSSVYSEDSIMSNGDLNSMAASAVTRSHRYKVAMTARARQRRMRRMKEKEETGQTSTNAPTENTEPASSKPMEDDIVPVNMTMTSLVTPIKVAPPTMNVVAEETKEPPQRCPTPKVETCSVVTPESDKAAQQRQMRQHGSPVLRYGKPSSPAWNDLTRSFISDSEEDCTLLPSYLDENAPLHKEFLPDLKDGVNGEEVRDAANFTSIQFQCSNLSGEVEMFSGDEMEQYSTFENDSTVAATRMRQSQLGKYSTNNDNSHLISGHSDSQCFQNEVWSEATTPSIINRGDIFHHKAAASIVSLLTPDRMFEAGLMAPEGHTNEEDDSPPDIAADSPTGELVSPGGLTFDDDPTESRGCEWKGIQQVVDRNLQSRKGNRHNKEDREQVVVRQVLTNRMVAPSQQLADLLSQIQRNVKATPEINRAFATRRKNACGALKILSAKEENRLKICWTMGVLQAISSVLGDVKAKTTDDLAYNANTEARNRIVSTLLNLSVNKKNRMLICNTPGVLEDMVKTIIGDNGESRQGCCTALLYLSKTSETRPLIVKCAGLLKALAHVVEVPKFIPPQEVPSLKKIYPNRYLNKFVNSSSPCTASGAGEDDFSSEGDDDSTSSRSLSDTNGSCTHDGTNSSISEADSEDDEEVDEEMVAIMSQSEKGSKVQNCCKTPDNSQTILPTEINYDADPNRFLHGARLSTFACLLCLVKNKDNAFTIAREESLVEALIGVSNKQASPSHPRAIAILAHLTRHPKNCHQLVFKFQKMLTTLQTSIESNDAEARKYALCALQNLSMDKSCRAPIAHTPKMISSLTERCRSEIKEEVLAAVASLQNLSDEPANLIQFTIVKNCIGTIISIAQSDKNDGKETDLTQFMAKNTLVTISFWFRKIATSGSHRMIGNLRDGAISPGLSAILHNAVLQPTLYNQWN